MTTSPSKVNKKAQRSRWMNFVRIVLTILTSISAIGLLIASFGGDINPSKIHGICLMVMTFPAWALLLIIMTILDLLWCRKALIIAIVTFICCASALWDFSPVNIISPSAKKYAECPQFSLLSYNVCNYTDLDGIYPDETSRTLSYILKTNADVVCLQESGGIYATTHDTKITHQQVDSLHKLYPYVLLNGRSQMLLSKYPAESIPTAQSEHKGNEIAVFRVNIEGTPITIINVHLQSYSLSDDDKILYRDITDLQPNQSSIKESLKDVRSQLLSKIQAAAELRALDAERIGNYIQHFGGPNVIVSGDFNDVPGCYTLRRLSDYDMHQVYPEVGLGPMITYHDNRFYFRIDHILYRGNLKPLAMKRDDQQSSDHYPLLAAFAIAKQDNK